MGFSDKENHILASPLKRQKEIVWEQLGHILVREKEHAKGGSLGYHLNLIHGNSATFNALNNINIKKENLIVIVPFCYSIF